MSDNKSSLSRRRFMIVGSATIAGAPLFAKGAEILPSTSENPVGTESSSQSFSIDTSRKANQVFYYITENCIGCQVCKAYCPVEAIRFGDCRNEIIQEKCISCGTCYRGCLISAISETPIK